MHVLFRALHILLQTNRSILNYLCNKFYRRGLVLSLQGKHRKNRYKKNKPNFLQMTFSFISLVAQRLLTSANREVFHLQCLMDIIYLAGFTIILMVSSCFLICRYLDPVGRIC